MPDTHVNVFAYDNENMKVFVVEYFLKNDEDIVEDVVIYPSFEERPVSDFTYFWHNLN